MFSLRPFAYSFCDIAILASDSNVQAIDLVLGLGFFWGFPAIAFAVLLWGISRIGSVEHYPVFEVIPVESARRYRAKLFRLCALLAFLYFGLPLTIYLIMGTYARVELLQFVGWTFFGLFAAAGLLMLAVTAKMVLDRGRKGEVLLTFVNADESNPLGRKQTQLWLTVAYFLVCAPLGVLNLIWYMLDAYSVVIAQHGILRNGTLMRWDDVRSYAWSPDGKHLAFILNRQTFSGAKYAIIPVPADEREEVERVVQKHVALDDPETDTTQSNAPTMPHS